MLDTIIRYVANTKQKSAKLRDTIIMHKEARLRDTIIMHARQVPDSCKKVPRPPDCVEPDFLKLPKDTIIQ
jgi:hypothetical protein